MTDPVARAARRQNLLDELVRELEAWGCPTDSAKIRAGHLLMIAERHGWTLPAADAPPLTGRGSTLEGRERARRIMANSRAGCTCTRDEAIALPPAEHPAECPARVTADAVQPEHPPIGTSTAPRA